MKVSAVNRTGKRLPLGGLKKAAAEVFRALARMGYVKPDDYELCLVLINASESRRLKRRLFRRNRPASVLSLDYGGSGEIFFSPAVARKEARYHRRSSGEETLRLIAHGAMHIAGCHHESSKAQARKFSELEKKLLQRLGVAVNDS